MDPISTPERAREVLRRPDLHTDRALRAASRHLAVFGETLADFTMATEMQKVLGAGPIVSAPEPAREAWLEAGQRSARLLGLTIIAAAAIYAAAVAAILWLI